MSTQLTENPGRLIKRTRSICPQCLQPLDADVIERDGEVWLEKSCPEHGPWSALLSSDVAHYHQRSSAPGQNGGCCATGCGPSITPQWANHSCTVLIEITERCNLTCPTCFAGSSPQHSRMMSLDEFTGQVDGLVAGGKTGADMIQLSGGEPTIHPKFFEMVGHLASRGFPHVTINSNGIRLARSAFVQRLAECVAGTGTRLHAYLQFDGFEEATNIALRGRGDLLAIKQKAIENCMQHGIGVNPVMTLTRGVNDHEVGDFLRIGLARPGVNNLVIQPAMYSGRYENPRRVDRLTLADAVRLVCEQFGTFEPRDFTPIPCSDPNCFGMAAALRCGDRLIPVSRYFPDFETWDNEGVSQLIERVSDTIFGPEALTATLDWALSGGIFGDLDDDEVEGLLDALLGAPGEEGSDLQDRLWKSLFVVSIKPFMDAHTYDQDRIDGCCVHILDERGDPVSFCEFNAINRPRREARQAARLRLIDA